VSVLQPLTNVDHRHETYLDNICPYDNRSLCWGWFHMQEAILIVGI